MTVANFSTLISQLLPDPQAGLLSGIAFGTKATLNSDLKDALITTGTLHIVALSGMNVSIITSLLTRTLQPMISTRLIVLLMFAFLIWFVSFVGPSPSIVRAALMAGVAFLSILAGRQAWPILTWALSLVLMLIWQPAWLFDISFQLSALATLGLILFAAPASLPRRELSNQRFDLMNPEFIKFQLQRAEQLILDELRVTLAAQVFTIPLIFFTFRRISLISPLTNLLIGWTMAPLTILGWIVPLLAGVSKPLALLPAWVSYSLLTYVIWIVRATSQLPISGIQLN